jgi:hypothetical protein
MVGSSVSALGLLATFEKGTKGIDYLRKAFTGNFWVN